MGQEAGGGEAKGLAPERWEQGEESSRRNPRRPKGEEASHAMLDFLIEAHEAGENLFEGRLNTHADWILIHLLLRNESLGRATVAKHVMENVPCAPGTVRAMLKRFSDHGYISTQQYIGRSELFQPTEKLRLFMMRWSDKVKSPPSERKL